MSVPGWWPRAALLAVLAVAAALRLVWLDREGWSNQYYAATVQSMLTGWQAFFFACYDPECFITVDKSPLGFWVQAAFAKVLGMSGVAVILPQALAGVASVAVLYALVRRAFGVAAGLLAALALAITPVSVATDRNSTIDGQLVLVVLLAAFATVRAAEGGGLRWLLGAFALVGLGFEIKMLQAYLILPALAVTYLVAARAGLARRVAHLSLASAVMLAISLAWPLAVDLTPAEARPYVGGSTDNSVLQLITGHNGIARLGALGRGLFARPPAPALPPAGQPGRPPQGPPGGPPPGPPAGPPPGSFAPAGGPSSESGEPGPFRLYNTQLAGQLSWLLPLALLGGAVAARRASWRPRPDRRATLLLLAGVWLISMGAFFSVTGGIFHRYYLVMLAPAVAALAGSGVVELWREHRARRGLLVVLLPLALAVTAASELAILAPFREWETRLAPVLLAGVLAALALAVAPLARDRVPAAAGRIALAVALLSVAAPQAAWAVLPVVNAPGGALPAAGPDARPGPPPGPAVRPPGGPPVPGPGRGDPRLAAFLIAQRSDSRWIVAVRSAMTASPLMLETKAPVLALGGFGGMDRVLDAAGFAALVGRGEVRYVLMDEPFLAAPPAGPQAPLPALPRQPDDPILAWVRATCAPVSGFAGLRDCAPR